MSHDLSPLGFRKTPFTRELTVRERFPLDPQAQVAAALTEAVQERMSAALIAPAGTGKTVALRMLVAALPETRFQVHYVKVTGLSKRDLCKEIAVACGLSPTGIYPALVRKLQDAFVHTTSDGMRPVILLDEAHDLRPESLAMLRVLTNFEMDSRLVVSLVLAGQPHLRLLLRHPDQAAIAHRLAHYAELRLLSRDETRAYLEHRCTLAGARTNPFDGDAQETIFEMSLGNLRAIDRLALGGPAPRRQVFFPHHRQCRRRDRRSQVAVAMTNPLPTVPVHAIDPQPDAPQWLVRDLWTHRRRRGYRRQPQGWPSRGLASISPSRSRPALPPSAASRSTPPDRLWCISPRTLCPASATVSPTCAATAASICPASTCGSSLLTGCASIPNATSSLSTRPCNRSARHCCCWTPWSDFIPSTKTALQTSLLCSPFCAPSTAAIISL